MTDERSWTWVTAIGRDRPGIVAAFTEGLSAAGGNIEDASMSRFHTWFAMMVLASFPREADPAATLAPIAEQWDLRLDVRRVEAADLASDDLPAPSHRISVYGTDRPGIVAAASRAVSDRGANILDLEVDVVPGDGPEAPPLFVMVMDVAVAEGLDDLQAALAAALAMEVHVVPLEGVIL